MKRFGVVTIVLLFAGCQTPPVNQSPTALPGFASATPGYYECDRCGSLDGGDYAAGPTKQLRSDTGKACNHDWYPISRNEFRELAVERFFIDWSVEEPFWSAVEADSPQSEELE
ncbi:MAG: hypothetical protein WD872_01225 [Pirellulaceae bacterium]